MGLSRAKIQMGGYFRPVSKVLIYLPMTYPTVSTRFFKSFIDLARNPVPGFDIDVHVSSVFPLDRSRNKIVQTAKSKPYEAEYLLMVDGDNILPKDALERLLPYCSDEFPVVSGLYFRKSPPYRAVPGHYSGWSKREHMAKTIESMGMIDKEGDQCAFYRPVLDFDTVQQIDVSGCGCLLIRMDVFDKIELPYFGYFNAESLGGDYSIDHLSEDMLFFCKLKKAGIKTLLVPQVRCGHEVLRVVGGPEEAA